MTTAMAAAMAEIDYQHIPRQTLFPAAAAKLVRADIQRRGSRVGYLMGAGDEVRVAGTTIGGEADHKAIDQRLDPAVEEINRRLASQWAASVSKPTPARCRGRSPSPSWRRAAAGAAIRAASPSRP